MIHVPTESGFVFRVPVDKLESALHTEKTGLAVGVARLVRMFDALVQKPPKLIEPSNSPLQSLALVIAIDAHLPNVKALLKQNVPALDAELHIINKLTTMTPSEIENWVSELSDPSPLLVTEAAVMYALTGQRQGKEQAVNASLKHLRKRTIELAEANGANLSVCAVYWQHILQFLKDQ